VAQSDRLDHMFIVPPPADRSKLERIMGLAPVDGTMLRSRVVKFSRSAGTSWSCRAIRANRVAGTATARPISIAPLPSLGMRTNARRKGKADTAAQDSESLRARAHFILI
jgi:hypothetical protein